jgi:ABC-2 type transport system ATP-binding protein
MQQKVQLVGTLLHEPDLVVLDEPFSGLDPLNARMVKDMILTLKREGRLVVLSTHQMDQVEELCDRIVMIDRGKRVLYGTVREIKKTYTEEIRNATGRGNVVVIDGEGALDPALKPETFLQAALASGCTVARFEAAPAPLEEIFVHVASKGEAALA